MLEAYTISEYYDLITKTITLDKLILYYLTIYILIVSIQRILKTEIDTEGKFRTNPKILLVLILIYSFGILSSIVEKKSPSDDLLVHIAISSIIFILFISLLERLFFGSNRKNGTGIFPRMLGSLMTLRAQIVVEEMKKENRTAVINESTIKVRSSSGVKEYRSIIGLFIIDLLALIFVVEYLMSQYISVGIAMLITGILFIKDPFSKVMEYSRAIINRHPEGYIR